MRLLLICDVCHAAAHTQLCRPTHYNWLLINIVRSVGAWELYCYFKSCNSATMPLLSYFHRTLKNCFNLWTTWIVTSVMMTLRCILMKMSRLSKQRIGRLVCSKRYYYVLIAGSLAHQLPLDMRVLLCWSDVYRQHRQRWHTLQLQSILSSIAKNPCSMVLHLEGRSCSRICIWLSPSLQFKESIQMFINFCLRCGISSRCIRNQIFVDML